MLCIGQPQEEVVMAAAFQGYRIPAMAARGTPLAKAGLAAGIGKAILLGVPAALIGVGLGFVFSKAFEVRWDEFSKRAADGESTMIRPTQ
jgi:hypothetical protein